MLKQTIKRRSEVIWTRTDPIVPGVLRYNTSREESYYRMRTVLDPENYAYELEFVPEQKIKVNISLR